jgi:histone H3/H4
MVSKEAVFLISVATEKFIERLAQAGQRIAERQSRATVQERDICEHTIVSPTDCF